MPAASNREGYSQGIQAFFGAAKVADKQIGMAGFWDLRVWEWFGSQRYLGTLPMHYPFSKQ